MLTKEEELAAIQEACAEATQMDIDRIESSEAVKKLLAQPELTDYGVYPFMGAEIRYRPHMTHKLRGLLGKAQKEIELAENPVKALDELVYACLAEICVDYPDSATWALIDERSTDGRVYKIFKDLVVLIGGSEQTLKDFRRIK